MHPPTTQKWVLTSLYLARGSCSSSDGFAKSFIHKSAAHSVPHGASLTIVLEQSCVEKLGQIIDVDVFTSTGVILNLVFLLL